MKFYILGFKNQLLEIQAEMLKIKLVKSMFKVYLFNMNKFILIFLKDDGNQHINKNQKNVHEPENNEREFEKYKSTKGNHV